MVRKKRITALLMIGICLMISLMATLVVRAGIIPGLSSQIDESKKVAVDRVMNAQTIPGSVYDDSGIKLAWNESTNDSRKYIDPYIYSPLFAFESGGLNYIYHKDIYGHGETKYEDNNGDTYYRGSDLHLTINNEIQRKVFALISQEEDASAVLLDKNGAVKCLVSSKTFNIYDLGKDYKKLVATDGAILNAAKDSLTPCGSVLKPIIGQIMTDYGYNTTFVVEDFGKIAVEGNVINNASSIAYGEIKLKKALIKSSNVYFVSAALHLGESVLEQRYDEFKIGGEIKCDFGTISSQRGHYETDVDLAMGAIGQNVALSTVQLAAIMEAIATGKLIKPYVIKSVTKDENTIKETDRCIVNKISVSDETLKHVNGILKECADSYGLSEDKIGYNLLAKTGTAEVETESGKKHVATMIAAWPADDPQFFLAVQSRNTDKYGRQMADTVAEIVQIVDKVLK